MVDRARSGGGQVSEQQQAEPLEAALSTELVPTAVVRSARKRTHHPEPRTKAVNVRFTAAEYAALVAAANRSDLSPTAYVGTAALAAATGTEAPGAPVREALTELMQARTAAVRIGVAVNKLAAKVLAGGDATAAEVSAAAASSSRVVARVEAAASMVHRSLA